MGRWRDAWKVLRGKAESRSPEEAEADLLAIDERYIRRDEVRELVRLMTDLQIDAASHFDKLNTMAARLRKRDQRAAGSTNDDGTGSNTAGALESDPTASREAEKANLRRQIIQMRAAR